MIFYLTFNFDAHAQSMHTLWALQSYTSRMDCNRMRVTLSVLFLLHVDCTRLQCLWCTHTYHSVVLVEWTAWLLCIFSLSPLSPIHNTCYLPGNCSYVLWRSCFCYHCYVFMKIQLQCVQTLVMSRCAQKIWNHVIRYNWAWNFVQVKL